MLKVETAVKDIFGSLNLRDDLTIQRFAELTLEVRKRVEGATDADRKDSKWLQYLLPPKNQEMYVLTESKVGVDPSSPESIIGTGTSLRRLLDETSDLIDSPPFAQVLTLLLDAGFSTLVDQKVSQQAFKIPVTLDIPAVDAPRITEIIEPKPVKLPIILATLTRQAHSIGNGMPNEYLQAMEQVRDLESFAAVVYSSNWESEISPMTGEIDSRPSTALKPGDSLPAYEDETGQASLVDVAAESTFQAAWGRAVSPPGKPSPV